VPYIRKGEAGGPWIPWADWFVGDQAEGKRRHNARMRQEAAKAAKALAMPKGARVVCTWQRIGQRRRDEIRGVLVRVYPYIVPGIVVAVVRLETGQRLKIDVTRVRLDRSKP
jgi:hypothetical protein